MKEYSQLNRKVSKEDLVLSSVLRSAQDVLSESDLLNYAINLKYSDDRIPKVVLTPELKRGSITTGPAITQLPVVHAILTKVAQEADAKRYIRRFVKIGFNGDYPEIRERVVEVLRRHSAESIEIDAVNATATIIDESGQTLAETLNSLEQLKNSSDQYRVAFLILSANEHEIVK